MGLLNIEMLDGRIIDVKALAEGHTKGGVRWLLAWDGYRYTILYEDTSTSRPFWNVEGKSVATPKNRDTLYYRMRQLCKDFKRVEEPEEEKSSE